MDSGMFKSAEGYSCAPRATTRFAVVLAITAVALMVVDYVIHFYYARECSMCVQPYRWAHFYNQPAVSGSYIPVICVIGIYAVLLPVGVVLVAPWEKFL